MIRVGRIAVVDGVEYKIEAEGGSAKEALAIVEAEAEALGAAPPAKPTGKGRPKKGADTPAAPPPVTPGATVGRVFEAPPGLVPPPGTTLPPGMTASAPNITSLNVLSGGAPSAPGGDPYTSAPNIVGSVPAENIPPMTTMTLTPPSEVIWDDGPPADLSRSVGFEPAPSPSDQGPPPIDDAPAPPAPPTLAEQIEAEHKRIVALKPEWKVNIDQALGVAQGRHRENLDLVLADLQSYGRKVAQALGLPTG